MLLLLKMHKKSDVSWKTSLFRCKTNNYQLFDKVLTAHIGWLFYTHNVAD